MTTLSTVTNSTLTKSRDRTWKALVLSVLPLRARVVAQPGAFHLLRSGWETEDPSPRNWDLS
jgi:hypothetical protein